MKIETFKMERMQSTWENVVEYNLSESGVHPLTLEEFLSPEELDGLERIRRRLHPDQRDRRSSGSGSPALYPGIGPGGILATAGSSEANFLLIWSLIEPGDEVLFELPNYMQMWGLLRGFGAKVKPFRLREELGWQPDPDEIAQARHPQNQAHRPDQPQQPDGRRPQRQVHGRDRRPGRRGRAPGSWPTRFIRAPSFRASGRRASGDVTTRSSSSTACPRPTACPG